MAEFTRVDGVKRPPVTPGEEEERGGKGNTSFETRPSDAPQDDVVW
jgi:hypothetical protein